ncbi:MAG: DUF5723 family protein [Bacteroidota bacterium]
MKLKLPLLSALLAAAQFSFAQLDFYGFLNSNYAGISAVNLNPASIANNRMKVDVALAGFGFSASNNYIGMKKEVLKHHPDYGIIGAYGQLIKQDSTKPVAFPYFEDSLFKEKYLIERSNSDRKSVFFNSNIVMPSFMFDIGPVSTFGFNWRIRNYINVDGIEPNLAHQIYMSLQDSAQWDTRLTNERVSIQYMSWAEYGFTYARVLKDEDQNFIKAGATLKLLQGLGAAYMFVENLDYMFSHEDTLFLFETDVQYGHSTNFEFTKDKIKYKYISNLSFGADFGFVWEYRPDRGKYRYDMDGKTNLDMKWKNKYLFKVGVSVLDVGAIKYKKGEYSHDFHADIDNWYIDTLKFDSVPVQAWDDTLRKRFPMNPSADPYFSMNLPTAFSVQLDFNIWKDFYVGLTAYQALKFEKNPNKVHELSTYYLCPRWDHKWFGVYLPVSVNSYRNFRTGLELRMGPLIIGTNTLGALLGNRDVFGADFHFLLKVPIPHGPVKDRDKDKVSDKLDKCIDVPGVWEFVGCADRDSDHVEDKVDVCPDTPGLKEFSGCPDRDGDKIIDSQDACPDDAGLPEFNGCPDRDGDKIIDKEDDCPDEAGLAIFKGCPDTDGDSIMDKVDKCPDKPGPIENKGCPVDKLYLIGADGKEIAVATKNDDGNFIFPQLPIDELCVFKLESYNEPPEITEVRVGVGTIVRIAKKGKDSFFRFEVLKPDPSKIKKLEEPDQVVKLTKEEEEVLKKAFDNLEFETGKDVIKAESYASLNELAALMKKKPTWKLKISGHTDNVGKPAANMELSKKRANAVKKYLAAQGITDDRFVVKWYGQTQPIAPNTTPEGRQKNRRVEMLIIE